MLALTRRLDYALIALCHMAQHPDRLITARALAARFRLPHSLLMNVLKLLAAGGVVRSARGLRGGYELAASPELVTLCDVIEAVEGPIRFVQCAAAAGGPAAPQHCELLDLCPVSAPVRRVHDRLKTFLTEVTLADIAFDPDYGATPAPLVEVAVAGRETLT